MNTHDQVQMAMRMGADGIDWWPYRIPAIELARNSISPEDLRAIGACHMSFRGETMSGTLKKIRKGDLRGAAFNAMIMAIMPHYYGSFQTLVSLNQSCRRAIRSVVYPYHYWDGDLPYDNWGKLPIRLVQPSTEHTKNWGVKELEDFPDYARSNGVSFCLDLFHMNFIKKQDNKTPIGTWKEIMTKLMPHTKLIHLGAGSPDFSEAQKEAGIDSMVWLADLIQPYPNSRIWDMLWWIKEHGYSHIPIVLEIPSSGIYAFSKSIVDSRFLPKTEYERLMAKIIMNIRRFMS